MAKNTKPTVLVDVPVSFGGVSIGVETAKIGIKIDRESMSLDDADEYLCGRRLSGRAYTVPKGEDPTQKHMFKGERHELVNLFDVKKISVSPNMLSCGLTFALQDVDVTELAQFASRGGRLEIYEVSTITKGEPGDDDEDGDDDGEE